MTKISESNMAFFSTEVRPAIRAAEEQWEDFTFAMQHADRFLAYGKPGSGKTRSASSVGLNGRPLIRTMITAETCRPEIIGHWGLGQNGMVWLDGPGTMAWRQGGRLVIDEIDEAGGDTIPALHAIADDNAVARLTLANGETLTPKEGFQLFATMNSDPKSIPEALRDRFVVKRQIDLPNPEVLFILPVQVRAAAANAIYSDFVDPAFAQLKSTRTWIDIARLTEERGLTVAQAIKVHGVDAQASKAIKAAQVAAAAA